MVAHDGSEGVSPGGWLPDRVSVGALTRTFPPELVDRVVEVTDTREVRRRLLPAPLVVYFVLALWLFRGRNCGYGRVMSKLVDGLYHRRRGRQLLDGVLDPAGWVDAGQGRRWRPPNISSLSRARARLGADPLHMLFEQVAGPVGGSAEGSAGDPVPGVFCCGLRVVSMDGSTSDVRATAENSEYFSRPSNGTRAGAFPQVRWLVAAESGTGALIGASFGPYTVGEQTLARDLLPALGPGMMVLADRNFLSHTLARDVLGTGAHILWRASASFTLTPIEVLAEGTYLAVLHPARTADGPPITVRVIEYTVHTSPADGGEGGDGGEEDSSEVFALVTDLLDAEVYPALELACAYPMRWSAVELPVCPAVMALAEDSGVIPVSVACLLLLNEPSRGVVARPAPSRLRPSRSGIADHLPCRAWVPLSRPAHDDPVAPPRRSPRSPSGPSTLRWYTETTSTTPWRPGPADT